MSELDSTVVTGAPSQLRRGPRRGDVLGERYELRRRFDDDGCITSFLAFDQELEEEVLLRSINLHGLKREHVEAALERLRHLRRIGGRYLCQIREVDRDGSSIFSIEPMPLGQRFSEMLKRRKSRRLLFSPVELLPVIARIEAALRAIPTGWYHGDIRSNRIWLAEDGLKLSGAFLLASVPDGGVDLLLQQYQSLRERLPPEFGRRSRGRATDVYCTAALAWEALTGEVPGPDPSPPKSGLDRSLAEVLRRCLRADPQRRLRTLEPMINALAVAAGGVAPTLDAEPVGALSPSAPLPDQSHGQDEEADSQAGTVRVPISGYEKLGLDTTEEHAIRPIREEEQTIPSAEGIDPRFLRAALDVTLDEASDETELMTLPPAGAQAHGKPKKDLHVQTTVELAVDPKEMQEIKAKGERARAARRRSKRNAEHDTIETRREQVGMSTEEMLAPPERRGSRESGRTQRRASMEEPRGSRSSQGQPAHEAHKAHKAEKASGKGFFSGKLIIAFAVVIAVLILSAGFLIARERQRSNDQHRAAQRRMQEIQGDDP